MIDLNNEESRRSATKNLADEIVSSIQFMVNAHIYHPKSKEDMVRFWDNKTPYIIHP